MPANYPQAVQGKKNVFMERESKRGRGNGKAKVAEC